MTGYQFVDTGHLWRSDTMGEDWTTIQHGDDSLGAFKLLDDCDAGAGTGNGANDTPPSSGKLLLVEPDPSGFFDWLWIAAAEPRLDKYGAVLAGSRRGIFAHDLVTGDTCEPFDPATLPTVTNPGVGQDALPSAMALVNLDADIDGAMEVLVVGYRVVANDGAVDRTALYACPPMDITGFECGGAVPPQACVPIDVGAPGDGEGEAMDVRDIEVVPADADVLGIRRLLVADGGRRHQDTSATIDECTTGFERDDGTGDVTGSTVWVLEVEDGDGNLATFDPVFDLWDTDAHSTGTSWAVDATGAPAPYFSSDLGTSTTSAGVYGCSLQASTVPTWGELVPPTEDLVRNGVSTVAVDPDARVAVAFFPLGTEVQPYGCVRAFRVALDDLTPGATPWLPLQSWVSGEMGTGENPAQQPGPHATARQGAVDPRDAYFAGFGAMHGIAPGNVQDATFVDIGELPGSPPDSLGDFALLAASTQLWLVPPGDPGEPAPGWLHPDPDGAGPLAPDDTAMTLAWGGGTPDGSEFGGTFQDNGGSDVATCHGCGPAGIDTVHFALTDLTYWKTWGSYGGIPSAIPAFTPCAMDKQGAGGSTISVWQDSEQGVWIFY